MVSTRAPFGGLTTATASASAMRAACTCAGTACPARVALASSLVTPQVQTPHTVGGLLCRHEIFFFSTLECSGSILTIE